MTEHPVGTRLTFQPPPVVLERLPDCDLCGAELWSRDGSGRYRNLGEFRDMPLLQPHTWLLDCSGDPS